MHNGAVVGKLKNENSADKEGPTICRHADCTTTTHHVTYPYLKVCCQENIESTRVARRARLPVL